jgi:Cu2+-containing amine oxidase
MGQQCDFKTITLREPEKKAVLAYIDAAKKDGPRPIIPRMSFSAYYLKGTVRQVPLGIAHISMLLNC